MRSSSTTIDLAATRLRAQSASIHLSPAGRSRGPRVHQVGTMPSTPTA
eukprot:CAMPEP_0180770550 /NCGR_PEP_ID=MMETSP1038_2-20121128/41695_1 /TAXON_ID=632150 /ORGANISM="Azadinium spinosum, Strain 3D9" /LENGTH=47 /DNA_ID= /DNA_START= /DNA_END= /DNA_ORIENTATION=